MKRAARDAQPLNDLMRPIDRISERQAIDLLKAKPMLAAGLDLTDERIR